MKQIRAIKAIKVAFINASGTSETDPSPLGWFVYEIDHTTPYIIIGHTVTIGLGNTLNQNPICDKQFTLAFVGDYNNTMLEPERVIGLMSNVIDNGPSNIRIINSFNSDLLDLLPVGSRIGKTRYLVPVLADNGTTGQNNYALIFERDNEIEGR